MNEIGLSLRHAGKHIGIAILVVGLVACSSPPGRDRVTSEALDEPSADALISEDFASVMLQIDSLDPSQTTLHLADSAVPDKGFRDKLLGALQQAGYAVRFRSRGADDKDLTYQITSSLSSVTGRMMTYEVSVGDVSLRRSYRDLGAGHVQPAATMLVKGANAGQIRLNDALFGEPRKIRDEPDLMAEGSGGSSQQGAVASPGRTLIRDDVRLAAVPESVPARRLEPTVDLSPTDTDSSTAAVVDGRVDAASSNAEDVTTRSLAGRENRPATEARLASRQDADGTGTDGPGDAAPVERSTLIAAAPDRDLLDVAAPTLSQAASPALSDLAQLSQMHRGDKRNVQDLGQSNFADFLKDYGLVRESVLPFGDDSLRLGEQNKQRIVGFVETFDADSDVFSIIGCSHGSTRYDDGNAGLAQDRAERVREALVIAGVPEEHILDEGCWAPEAFDQRMPRRGVVLSLKRKPS